MERDNPATAVSRARSRRVAVGRESGERVARQPGESGVTRGSRVTCQVFVALLNARAPCSRGVVAYFPDMHRAAFLALAVLSLALAACSAGTGGDWPIPDLKGPLADCHALGDVCGGSGWCGSTRESVLVCCPVELEDGVYCPGAGTPGVTECAVDADCPREECHEASACLGGVCFAPKQAVRTYCSAGVCSEDGACEPCAVDADCEAVNTNECAALVCGDGGRCEAQLLPVGTACNFTAGGTCTTGNHCVVTD